MAADDWTDEPPPADTTTLQKIHEAIDPIGYATRVGSAIYNDPKGALQTVDDAVRAAANAVTIGNADRFAAYMNQKTGLTDAPDYSSAVDEEVAKSQQARERSPTASTVGDVGGSMLLPGFGAESLATRWGGGALARAGAYGLTGAATGAAQGAGGTYSGNAQDYATNALIGGGLGGLFGGVGGAAFGPRAPVSTAVTPNSAELQQAKNLRYAALAQNPTQYDARALSQTADNLEQGMLTGTGRSAPDRFAAGRRDSPSTWGALDEMRLPASHIGTGNPPVVAATTDPAGIDSIRKGLNQIPYSAERSTDRASARVVKGALDDFVINPPPGAVIPGYEQSARVAAGQARSARAENMAFKRTQAIENLYNNAVDKAASQNSGLNVEANLRGGVRSFIATPVRGVSQAAKSGFNPQQIGQLQGFVRGTKPGNALRYAANILGGGGGMGALGAGSAGLGYGAYLTKDDPELSRAFTIGASVLNPVAGFGLRTLANRSASRNMQNLIQGIAQDSPLYRARAAVAPMVQSGSASTAKAARDAVTTALVRRLQGASAPDDWR